MLLFLLLVAIPILEIALFIQVGGAIGTLATIVIVVATALAGTLLLRSQGLATMTKLQNSVADGSNPMNPIAHGALILVAGVLLLTPGFFTDATGLALLIPPVRDALIKAGAARMTTHVFHGQTQQRHEPPKPDEPIDADYEVVDEDVEPGSSGWTQHNKND